jgi:hypothetical protein
VPARRIPEDFDPASTDDPDEVHALYRDLRVRCPVAHTDSLGSREGARMPELGIVSSRLRFVLP